MNDLSNVENARAASEARESVVSAHPSSSAAAAMRRYLRSEQYHELRAGEGPPAGEQDPAEPAG